MLDDIQTLRIDLTGELDISRAAELRDGILTRHSGEEHVIVDLAEVTFIDSSALRALLNASTALADRAAVLTIARPSPAATRLLQITGMTEFFGLPAQ
jgi:anti-sigma B factor antagonist